MNADVDDEVVHTTVQQDVLPKVQSMQPANELRFQLGGFSMLGQEATEVRSIVAGILSKMALGERT